MVSVRAAAFGAGLLLAMVCGGAAEAVPIVLTYTGVVSASGYAGASVSDSVTFKVFADNGGSDLLSQTWTTADITGASFQAGSYSAATSGALGGGSFANFKTDAGGSLTFLDVGMLQNGTDSSGNTSFTYFMNGVSPIWLSDVSQKISVGSAPTISNTTIALAPTIAATPLPAALPMLATALGGLAFVGWRRRRAAA